jgi:predicted nucleotidyltransferase
VTSAEVISRLRRILAGRADVRMALLFGSHARDAARPDSDVDVAVDTDADLLDLAAELTLALECEVDVVSLDDPGVPLLEALVRDGVVVHEGVPGRGARWRSHALTTLETDRPWYTRMADAWLQRVAERGIADG